MYYNAANWQWKDHNGVQFYLKLYTKTERFVLNFNNIENVSLENKFPEGDYFGFVGSAQLKVNIVIEAEIQDNLLAYLVNEPENGVYAVLSGGADFTGYLLPEIIEFENAPHPYSLSMTFTDGLTKLKEVTPANKLNIFLNQPDEQWAVPIKELIKEALIILNVWDLHTAPLKMRAKYSPSNYSGNPLNCVVTPAMLIEFKNAYEVIDELCRLHHARFYYDGKSYVFENIDNMLEASFIEYQNGFDGGSAETSSTISTPVVEVGDIYAGGSIRILPTAGTIKVTYKVDGDVNMLSPYFWDNTTGLLTVGSAIYGGHGHAPDMRFNIRHFTEWEIGGGTEGTYQVIIDVYIMVGDYYLKRSVVRIKADGSVEFGAVEWTTTLSAYRCVMQQKFARAGANTNQFQDLYEIVIKTPPIPEEGFIRMDIKWINPIVVMTKEGGGAPEFTLIKYENTYNEVRIGYESKDDAKYIFKGAIDSNFKELAFDGYFFDVGDSGLINFILTPDLEFPTGESIQVKFIKSVSKFRGGARLMHFMRYKGDYLSFNQLIDYDELCMITRYENDYITGEVMAEFVELSESTEATVTVERTKKDFWTTQLTDFSEGGPGNTNVISNTAYRGIFTVNPESGSPASIEVEEMIGNYYEGDYFIITQNAMMMTMRGAVYVQNLMRLTADIEETETELFCTGTLTFSYLAGSEIIFNARPVNIWHKLDTSSAVTEYENAFIPDPVKLSFAAIQRKVRVVLNGVDMNAVETLSGYNDFKVSTGKIEFNQNMQNEKIIIEFEKWEDLL